MKCVNNALICYTTSGLNNIFDTNFEATSILSLMGKNASDAIETLFIVLNIQICPFRIFVLVF